MSWYTTPFYKTLGKLVRPSTALSRRKTRTIKVQMPRQCFEKIMEPLVEGDATNVKRDSLTNKLVPTSSAGSLLKFDYTISKGSVSDRLFHLDQLDVPPRLSNKRTVDEMEIGIGQDDVYEVEAILEKRTKGKKRTEYLIKWLDWPASTNTWEAAARINPALVAAFEGKPLRARRHHLLQPPRGGWHVRPCQLARSH